MTSDRLSHDAARGRGRDPGALRALATGLLVLCGLCSPPTTLPAGEAAAPTQGGAVLLEQARESAARIRDKSMRVAMTIHGESGTPLERSLLGFEKQTADGRKILWVFDSPSDLAGTRFLAWRQPEGRELLWVYFPAQHRVRQVNDQMRRERFQGSDLTYEDLTAIVYFDYDGRHSVLGSEPCGPTTCQVIESELAPGRFAYRKLRTWLREDLLLPERIEFFTEEKVKEIRILDASTVAGIPTVLALEAKHLRDGSRTTVRFSDVHYNSDLADEKFSIAALSQGG